MDIEEIIAKAAAAATAAAAKEADKAEKAKIKAQSAADSPASKRAAAAEKSRLLLEAARARDAKLGLDLVEELLRDISPNILRFLVRDDADRLLNSGVRLIINFSKTDESGTIPSFNINRSGSSKLNRTVHRASIEQWAASEQMFLDRYRSEGGNPSVASHHELMLELIQLNKENERLRLLLEHAGRQMAQDALPPGSTEMPQDDAVQSQIPENPSVPESAS